MYWCKSSLAQCGNVLSWNIFFMLNEYVTAKKGYIIGSQKNHFFIFPERLVKINGGF